MAGPGVGVTAGRARMFVALLIALCVALGGLLVAQWRGHGDPYPSAERAHVLTAADQVAVGLTSMSQQTLKDDYAAFLDLTTGDLRSSFEQQGELFTTMFANSKVRSAGHVVAHAVVSLERDRAEVLVATRAQVHNKEAPNGEARQYRMRIELVRGGGRWLARSLELVP